MNDRIKLAKMVGRTMDVWGASSNPMKIPDERFDPFTDANDDVAVLVHFQDRAISHPDEWQAFKDYFMDVRADWNIWNYSIGLFARAALKVIK